MNIFHTILKNPLAYTYLRKLAAGNQNNTRQYILSSVKKYRCTSVLDLCCGTGDFAIFDNSVRYVGIDSNPLFISYACKRFRNFKNISFNTKNILKDEIQGKYDAVLLISTIHHFSDREMGEIINKILLCTKKIIIVADIIPDPPSIVGKFLISLDSGSTIRKPDDKIRLFKNAGLSQSLITKTGVIHSLFAYQYTFTVHLNRRK